jgi:TonB family protein
MRYARVIPTRMTGPEWIEPEPPEPDLSDQEKTGSMVLAFHREEELPADFALDLRLHEILETALQNTPATGAMIALASGDKMVCRATSGEKVPETGSFLNTRSGLSGLCVRTREMQHCDDTHNDARVNAEACRALDVRSIVVLPVLEGTRLWGIIEIFSSLRGAFNDHDLLELRALARDVTYTVREAVEGGNANPSSDPLPASSHAKQDRTGEEQTDSDKEAREILKSGLQDPSRHRRDYRTGGLTVAVVALAVLLGWMVGRVGWKMSFNQAQSQIASSPMETQIVAQTPRTAPTAIPQAIESGKMASVGAGAPLASKPGAAGSADGNPGNKPETKAVTKIVTKVGPKPEGVEPDGLVVYEQGKVVFRMPAAAKSPAPATDSGPVQDAAEKDGDGTPEASSVSPSPSGNYLLERVEPRYPEEAKEQRIEGAVVLNALVGTDGAVRELKVVSGEPLLAKAATDAVSHWRFQPHRVNERPVEFETQITVNFALP